MARKNPVGKLAETAFSTLKDPKSAAEKVVDQAKGTVALGRVVADTAGAVAGQLVQRATGRGGAPAGSATASAPPVTRPDSEEQGSRLRAVPDVNEPAGTQPPAAKGAAANEGSAKKHGDQLGTVPTATKAPAKPAKKTSAKKTATAKAPAGKTSARKTAEKMSPDEPVRPPVQDVATKKVVADAAAAKKSPAKKSAAKKAPAKKSSAKKAVPSPAEVAEVIETKVAEDPQATAAQPAKKASAKKAPAKESPVKKTTATETTAKTAPPKTAAELVADEGPDVTTPSGIPAAGEGMNPSTGKTDLVQPGTAPVEEPPAGE